MKRYICFFAVILFVVVSAFAGDFGKIAKLEMNTDGTFKFAFDNSGNVTNPDQYYLVNFTGTDIISRYLSVALTAKINGQTVNVGVGTTTNGMINVTWMEIKD